MGRALFELSAELTMHFSPAHGKVKRAGRDAGGTKGADVSADVLVWRARGDCTFGHGMPCPY
jgi:hypothetical protein